MNYKQIRILECLYHEYPESVVYYSFLEGSTGFSRKELHREITRLRNLGFVEHTTAWDEANDYPCGSGFTLKYDKINEIKKIIGEI